MARRSEEESGLPSFFQDNPWLDILAQRGVKPSLNFTASEMSSAPMVNRAKPTIEPEPIASQPTTSAVSFSREFVVRLEVPPELVEAIRELKEAIIMALSMSQRQATIVPIYIPISVSQVVSPVVSRALGHATTAEAPARTSDEVICPKCGRFGKLVRNRRGRRTYILVLHNRQTCYLGPEDVVKVKWPSLAERSLLEIARHQRAEKLSPRGRRPDDLCLAGCQTPERLPLAERVEPRGCSCPPVEKPCIQRTLTRASIHFTELYSTK